MIRTLTAFAAALALTACSAEREASIPADNETTTTAETAKPTLAGSEYDPYLALRSLDPQWGQEPFDSSSNYTASLGLLRVNHFWRNTSLTFDLANGGGVYMIQVRSGLPGRCDKGPDLALAFDRFTEDLAVAALANEIRPQMVEAWRSKDGWEEVDLGKVLVRAIGGCPRALVIKAH